MTLEGDFERTMERLRRSIDRRVGWGDPDGEDVLHDTLLAVLEYENENEGTVAGENLFFEVLRWKIAELFRSRSRSRRRQARPSREDDESETDLEPSDDGQMAANIVESDRVPFSSVLQQTPLEQASKILAVFGVELTQKDIQLLEYAKQDLSQAEIASRRKITRAAVSQQVSRMAERLGRALDGLKADQIYAALELESRDRDGDGPRRPARRRRKGSGKRRSRDGPNMFRLLSMHSMRKENVMFEQLRFVAALLAQEILALPAFREEQRKMARGTSRSAARAAALGVPHRRRVVAAFTQERPLAN